jgi:hypothetical protein
LPSWWGLQYHWRQAAAEQEEAMKEVLKKWQRVAGAGLDYVTSGEVAELAEFALAGPGVVLGRALYRFDQDCIKEGQHGSLLQASWNGTGATRVSKCGCHGAASTSAVPASSST